MKKPDLIALTKEQRTNAVAGLREYMKEHLEADAGNMQTEFLLDYITEHIGIYYYNRAVADAMAFIGEKTEDMYLLMKDEE